MRMNFYSLVLMYSVVIRKVRVLNFFLKLRQANRQQGGACALDLHGLR